MDKLRVGIVGCGAVAVKRHIPSFIKLNNAQLVAVCDNNLAVAKEVASKFNIPNTYENITDMLSSGKLNIVDICTPPKIHKVLAVEALNYGCHVLLEKPMALSTIDCDEMILASKNSNKKLCVVHNVLFHPPMIKAKSLVSSGIIGRVVGTRIYLSDPKNEMIMRRDYWIHKLPGGLIGETCPHPVYLSLAFMDKVKNVDIFAKNILEHSWAKFDEFRVELEGENTMSSIMISYSTNRYNATMEIIGTEGMLSIDLQSMLCILYKAKPSLSPMKVAVYNANIISQTLTGLIDNGIRVAFNKIKLGHENVIRQFVDSVINNTKSPITEQEGKEVVSVMEKIVNKLYEKYGQ